MSISPASMEHSLEKSLDGELTHFMWSGEILKDQSFA